jgi:3-deoxy-manno-octulosonate cytidylyltransferase (CMP-KDO synthetase)
VNHAGANPQTKPKSKIVAVIPARFASTRLPGKPLLEIAGKPMICWVLERALRSTRIGRVIVATDDERILGVVRSAGHEAVMTRVDHVSGTDRVAEVAEKLDEAEIIVNIQGDEPMIAPETVDRAIAAMAQEEDSAQKPNGPKEAGEREVGIATTWEPIESAIDVLNPDVVKIVVGDDKRAVYFSRCPVPYPRNAAQKYGSIEAALANEPGLLGQFRKHTGLYVYRKEVLLAFTRWPQSPLEQLESLEQLRALEHGVVIKAIQAPSPSIGVDSSHDLDRVRSIMEKERFELWL